MMKSISCIIPAYNEAERIGAVLDAVQAHPLLSEVIVVDDGSSDNTTQIVKMYPLVKLITHAQNEGKSKSVVDGVRSSKGDIIFLLDADLLNLSQKDITALFDPVIEGWADVAISYRKNSIPLFPFRKLDYLSGERIFSKSIIIDSLDYISTISGYGLEVFLNDIYIRSQSRIAIVYWPEVQNKFQQYKRGWILGIMGATRVWLHVLSEISIFGMYSQNFRMIKLIVNPPFTISLIVPAYNEEKRIEACLQSVIQNSQGFIEEIIVIDNASTDRTGEIARSFSGVKVIYESKKGPTQARQRGFIESRGNILAYIDADTLMPEGWCRILSYEFAHDSNLACLSGPYKYYDISNIQQFLVKLYWLLLGVPTHIMTGYMAVGGNFALRREVLEKMNGFDTNVSFYGDDTNTARRAHEFGKVKFMLQFYMNTSGRRLHEEGFIKTSFTYVLNFLSEVFLKKPATKEYEDIR